MLEAIYILEREKQLLEDCLKGWKSKDYPTAFELRNQKLKEITKGLELLKKEEFKQ